MGNITYEDTAKKIRNRLRSYSAVSVVRHALEITQSTQAESMLDQLQTLPWITFLLVKLTLEDKMTAIYKGKPCPKIVFDRCKQELWDAEKVPDSNDAKGSMYLMLRSLIQAQLPFQKKINFDFLRWPALIARLDSAHPVKLQFINRFGMEPDTFICICYTVYAGVVNGSMTIKQDYFEPILPVFSGELNRFMSEFARDLDGVRSELRRQLVARTSSNVPARPRYESFEFPWLSNYPLLKDGNSDFLVWHPMIFARGMEFAVHKRLSEYKGDYTTSFSKVFEDYVLELINEAGIDYLGEQEYKNGVGADKNAVEAIIVADETNIFIESKFTAYSEQLTLSDLRPVVWTHMKRVREAMKQGWMVSSSLRDGGLADWECTRSKEDFLVIVTSQQTSCATGEHFQRMFNRDIFDPHRIGGGTPTVKQLEKLPLQNIVIVSIEEFEHLIGCIQNGEINLVEFLREVAAAHVDPKTSVMFIDQMLGSKTKRWKLPPLLENASQRAVEILSKIL
jgi:hypothetical protein